MPRGRRHIPAPGPLKGRRHIVALPPPQGVTAIFPRRRRDAGGSRLGGVQGTADPHPRLREDHIGAQPRQLLPVRLQLCLRHARHLRPRYRRDETLPPSAPPGAELSSDAGTGTRGWAHRGARQRREDTGTWTGKGHTQGHRDTGPGSNSTGRGTGHWDTGTRDIDKNTARTRGHGTQTNTRRGQRDRHRDMRHSMDTGTDTRTSGQGTQLGHWERCRGYRDTVTQRGPDMGHGTEGQTHSWA